MTATVRHIFEVQTFIRFLRTGFLFYGMVLSLNFLYQLFIKITSCFLFPTTFTTTEFLNYRYLLKSSLDIK